MKSILLTALFFWVLTPCSPLRAATPNVLFIIPHLPWVCDERFSVPFRDQGLSPELAACYGSIAQLDASVGRLLAGLKQAGQDRRTIIVFVSDDGMTDKFHALPGGATALFDLAADPGETADVSATFPDTARELARECRRRWDGIMAGGRAFGMPTILVGGPAAAGRRGGASIVPGSAAQSLTGRVRVVQQTAQGFAHLGDGVQYSLDVQASGRYQVMVRGQDLDACGPLSLHLAGVVLTPVKSVPTAISFGVTALQAGSTVLEITTGAVPAGVKPATIKDIALTPVAAGK
jgi:hypothetical protein